MGRPSTERLVFLQSPIQLCILHLPRPPSTPLSTTYFVSTCCVLSFTHTSSHLLPLLDLYPAHYQTLPSNVIIILDGHDHTPQVSTIYLSGRRRRRRPPEQLHIHYQPIRGGRPPTQQSPQASSYHNRHRFSLHLSSIDIIDWQLQRQGVILGSLRV